MLKNSEIINKTIKKLSEPNSYKNLYNIPRHGEKLPSVIALKKIVDLIKRIIYPGYFGNSEIKPETMDYYIGVNVDKVYQLLIQQIKRGLCFDCSINKKIKCTDCEAKAKTLSVKFIEKLPEIRKMLATDVIANYEGDPAAKGYEEVIFCYPAIIAITHYRIAHNLLELGVPLIPRIITEMAHSETGIDIHPGAKIGEYFCIDHGTGVVIGETCIIGNKVKIYQGVTLGAKSFPVDDNGNPIKGILRHPIVEDNVVFYAHATILGRITIGKNSIIGGNVWVTNDVKPNSKVLK